MKILTSFLLLSVGLLGCGFSKTVAEDENDASLQDLTVGRRIAGGVQALGKQFSFVVPIESFFYNHDSKKCTGTLLSDRAIITSTSCLTHPESYSNIDLVIATVEGKNYIFSEDEIVRPSNYINSYRRPNSMRYSNYPNFSEVVVLRLSRRRKAIEGLSSMIFPKLPDSELNKALDSRIEAVVTGYGDHGGDEGSTLWTGLNYANVTTLTKNACYQKVSYESAVYSSVYLSDISNGKIICSAEIGIGICQGDEGGSLLVKYRGDLYIAGIHLGVFNTCEIQVHRSPLPMIHLKLWLIHDIVKDIVNYKY